MIKLPESDNEFLRSIEANFIIDQDPSGQMVPIEDLLRIQKQKNKHLDVIDNLNFNAKLTNEYVDELNAERRELYSDYAKFRSETHALIAELNDSIIDQRNHKYFWIMISTILAAAFFAAAILI